MTSNSFETLSEVASKLIERKTKTQLIYAFNGSGKTRLSLEIKELLATKSFGDENQASESTRQQSSHMQTIELMKKKKLFYYNAFTEDLFTWDNDLSGDTNRELIINNESLFVQYIIDVQGMHNDVINTFQSYLGILPDGEEGRSLQNIIEPIFDGSKSVAFRKTYTKKNVENNERITEENIKLSKGEETNFIWSLFYTFINQVITDINDGSSELDKIEYIIIDDPVSSLDEQRVIEVAIDIANLIRESNYKPRDSKNPNDQGIKFIVTTHHPLFFNVLFNELKKKNSDREVEKEKNNSYCPSILEHVVDFHNGLDSYILKDTNDSPFSYHIEIIEVIQQAVQNNSIKKYHFNLLRTLFEKTSTFLGYGNWEDLLVPDEDEGLTQRDIDIYCRKLNLFSHNKHSMEENSEIPEEDLTHFKNVFGWFISKYNFKSG
ncbi:MULTISPECIES: anticodon nuclease [unclassified Streptococcus]|uniref:anticodon nuclease n=1 Tax=unclassified Streptococcus TaxID=2608887 RepID=UPI0018A9FBAD|nr:MULTISPECIES: anticodon nuclease [unclassified Streptococcus]MBF8969973.1 anticodon nuclease [Streptococcus sp. NLN76]MBG9368064.1 hypothetical protein [Streptococcus sp. NLN64]